MARFLLSIQCLPYPPEQGDPAMAHSTTVEVGRELRACPKCGYQNGFHVAFERVGQGTRVAVRLVCPSCSAVFEIGLRAELAHS